MPEAGGSNIEIAHHLSEHQKSSQSGGPEMRADRTLGHRHIPPVRSGSPAPYAAPSVSRTTR